jgi:G protein-coupled receptor 107
LEKLQLFRSFYVMVVAYIYFTRIVVFLLAATIPFYVLWVGEMFTELATLLFFVVTGFKFRPAVNNPYLPVRSEEAEGGEFGLRDDEDDLLPAPRAPTEGNIGTGIGTANKAVEMHTVRLL